MKEITRLVTIDLHEKAYVCVHVFDKTRPVLLVSRCDGDWCFLCGAMHADNGSEYRVVGIGHVLENDPSLKQLDLSPEWEAERESLDGTWIKTPCNLEDTQH
jgi:hypothetical protein